MASGFQSNVLRQGMGYLPTDVEMAQNQTDLYGRERNRPEDIYPNFAELIRKARKANPKLTDEQILRDLNELETTMKSRLPDETKSGQVDVEVFGRKPNLMQRVLAPALEQSGINPASRMLGLPTLLPKEVAQQSDYMGGIAPIAGRVLGDIPLVMATGGLGKLAGMGRPLLTDVIAGGAFGALSPMLQGESPTMGGVAGNAAAFGGLGALGRKVFPRTMGRSGAPNEPVIQPRARTPLHPDEMNTWIDPSRIPGYDVIQPGTLPPLHAGAELGSVAGVPGMPRRGAVAYNAEATSAHPIEAGFETLPGLPRYSQEMPSSTASPMKMLTEGEGERLLGDFRGIAAKMTSGKPSDRMDYLRARRDLSEMGFIPSLPVKETIEEATIRARDAVAQLGKVRADIADVGRSLAKPDIAGKFATQAERDAEMIRYFRSGGEHEGITTLHMGFNPFEVVKDLKKFWTNFTTPASAETMATLRGAAKEPFYASTLRIPEVIFNKAGAPGKSFWGIVANRFRDPYEQDLIKHHNILWDAVKPILRKPKQLEEMIAVLDGAEATTPGIKEIAARVRKEYLDPIYQRAAASEIAQGREAPGYVKDYMRHALDRTETYVHIKEQIAAGEKSGGDVKALKEMLSNFVSNKGRHYMADDAIGVAGKDIMREMFNPTPVKEAAAGALEKRTANLGTWVKKDPLGILEGYAASVLRKTHLDPLLEDLSNHAGQMTPNMRDRAISLIRDMSGMQHPSVAKWEANMQQIGLKMSDMVGGRTDPEYLANVMNINSISRAVRSLEYMRTMYGNVGGALVNMTQIPLMTFPMLAQQYGPARAAKAVMNAMIQSFQPGGHGLAREMGAFRTRTAAGLEGQPQMLERLPELLDLFSMTETKINRPISGIAKYMLEREGGKSHENAIKDGIKFIRQTQFNVDPTTIPEAFRGPVGRMGYQYQSFKQQGLNFFINSLDKKGKAYFAGMLLAVGGPTGMPVLSGPLRDMMAAVGVPDQLASGLPGLMNVDLGRRINPVDNITGQNPQEIAGRTMQSSLGPVVGAGVGILSAIQRLAKYGPAVYNGQLNASTAARAVLEPVMRELEPVGLQRIAAGLEVAQTGELRAGQPSGVKMLLNAAGVPSEAYPGRYGGYNKIAGVQGKQGMLVGMGIPTIERTLQERVAAKAARMRDINALQRDRIIEGYLYFKSSGDNSALVEAMEAAPGVDLRSILKQVEMDPMTRIKGQTPKRMRGELPDLPTVKW